MENYQEPSRGVAGRGRVRRTDRGISARRPRAGILLLLRRLRDQEAGGIRVPRALQPFMLGKESPPQPGLLAGVATWKPGLGPEESPCSSLTERHPGLDHFSFSGLGYVKELLHRCITAQVRHNCDARCNASATCCSALLSGAVHPISLLTSSLLTSIA